MSSLSLFALCCYLHHLVLTVRESATHVCIYGNVRQLHVHNSMCQCYCHSKVTGNQCESSSLRQCNAHYNNFHENAFTDLTSQWATLFNSLKVHINKTTCARVLSEKRQLSTLPLPHSKLIIRFFAAIMSSFIHSFIRTASLIGISLGERAREENLN